MNAETGAPAEAGARGRGTHRPLLLLTLATLTALNVASALLPRRPAKLPEIAFSANRWMPPPRDPEDFSDLGSKIPRPFWGICPPSFELWRYSLRRPPVCVRRA